MSRSPSRNTSPDIRIVGVDDGSFPANRKIKHLAVLVAVLFQNSTISSIRLGHIEVDGNDANEVLLSMLKTLRFDVVMLSGISFGGFNLIDIAALAKSTRKPVIAITKERPNNTAVRSALRKHFADWHQRWRIVKNAGKLYSFRPIQAEPKLYFEVKGASASFAERAIASAAVISRLPEPIRVAGIVARGLSGLTGATVAL